MVAPEQFGVIAMLTIFTTVLSTFVSFGLPQALMRKNDRTPADCNAVFWFNIGVASAVYAVLYLGAPLISQFFGMDLTALLRVLSLCILIEAPAGVHRTLLQAGMQFKRLGLCNMVAVAFSGGCGIILASRGYGAWALVGQALTVSVADSIGIWLISHWRPGFRFNIRALRPLLDFGWKLQASVLLDTVYTNTFGLVIGKVFQTSELAFYGRATGLARLTSSTPTQVLQSVTYPALCYLQHDDDALRSAYRRMLRMSAFTVFPLCLGLGAVAYPAIQVVYTQRWIAAAPLLQILCFAMMWYPIHAINLNLLQVKGRSDLFLRLEIIKKVIGVCVLLFTATMSVAAICYGMVLTSVVAIAVNAHYTGRLIGLGVWQQIREIFPAFLLSSAMFGVCLAVVWLTGADWLGLIVSVAAGAGFYIISGWIVCPECIRELRLSLQKKGK